MRSILAGAAAVAGGALLVAGCSSGGSSSSSSSAAGGTGSAAALSPVTVHLGYLRGAEPGDQLSADQDQTDMPSTIAIMIVILILGIAADAGFGVANRAIRKRRGLS